MKIIEEERLQKKIFSMSNNQNINFINKNNSSKVLFNNFKKYLLQKEIEFDNVFTKKKKKSDDNITLHNFSVNNLINILNKKNIFLNKYDISWHRNLKNINKHTNENKKLNNFKYLKNDIQNCKNKKNDKKHITLTRKLNHYNIFNNYNTCLAENNKFEYDNFIKTLNFMYTKHNINKKQKSILNLNKNHMFFEKYNRNINSLECKKNKIPNFLLSSDIFKIKNVVKQTNFLKQPIQEKNFIDNKASITYNSQNMIKWKKSINQKILLSIFNKESKAVIYLKPKYFGSIYINIKMHNNHAALELISNHNIVKIFLDNSVKFLRKSLLKSGIKLKRIDIYDSNCYTIKKFEKKYHDNIFHEYKYMKFLTSNNRMKILKNQKINIFV